MPMVAKQLSLGLEDPTQIPILNFPVVIPPQQSESENSDQSEE
ncbi:MAG: hypothetical protein ACK4NX_02300 [Candidatus Paceibacteria bacterium]